MPALSPAQTIFTTGQQLNFTCPANQMVNPAAVVVFNKSSYELETNSGQLIPAWGIVPITLAAGIGSGVSLILTTILASGAVAAPVATVYCQWFSGAEAVPDETAFTADAIAAAITGSIETAGIATVVKTGTVNVSGTGSCTINFSGVPQTTRVLLLNLLCTAAPVGGINCGQLAAVGGVSQQQWFQGTENITPETGGVPGNFVAGVPALPLYMPWYGSIDPTGQFVWDCSTTSGTFQYWVIALPDANMQGTNAIPTVVSTNPVGGFVAVEQVNGETQTTPAGGGLALTTGYQMLVSPPAVGFRVVDTISILAATAADIIAFEINGTPAGMAFSFATNMPPFPVHWTMTTASAGILVKNQTAGRGDAYATYRDTYLY